MYIFHIYIYVYKIYNYKNTVYSSFLRLKPPMDPVPSLRTRAVLAPKVVAFCSAAIRAIKARRVPLLSWTYLEGTTWAGGIYSHPVGKLWKMAIEIVDLPSYKWWFSIVMLVYQVAIQLGNPKRDETWWNLVMLVFLWFCSWNFKSKPVLLKLIFHHACKFWANSHGETPVESGGPEWEIIRRSFGMLQFI